MGWGLYTKRIVGAGLLGFAAVRTALDIGGYVDFVLEHTKNPGWIGVALNFLLHLPQWIDIPLIAAGLGLIYWDLKRPRASPSLTSRDPSTPHTPAPDWPIHEALFALEPDLLDGNAWEAVLGRLLDLLASGEVCAWGRRHAFPGNTPGPLARIRQEFWENAGLSGVFLAPGKEQEVHAFQRVRLGNMGEEYSDLRFDRRLLEATWKLAEF